MCGVSDICDVSELTLLAFSGDWLSLQTNLLFFYCFVLNPNMMQEMITCFVSWYVVVHYVLCYCTSILYPFSGQVGEYEAS